MITVLILIVPVLHDSEFSCCIPSLLLLVTTSEECSARLSVVCLFSEYRF